MDIHAVAKKIRDRSVVSSSGCLEWQGAKNQGGYGVIRYDGRQHGVHRIMLAAKLNDARLLDKCEQRGGRARYALHSCDNTACCNPDHLRIGTAQENGDDARERKRHGFNPNLPRKLSEIDVLEIRRVGKTWEGMCDMMKKHKTSQGSITDVIKGRTYRHVESLAA